MGKVNCELGEKGSVKCFVPNRFAAAARRSGAGCKHQCFFLHSFHGPASYLWSKAKIHRERSRQTKGGGTPQKIQSRNCLDVVTSPFLEMLLYPCAFVVSSDLGKCRIQVA